MNSPFIEHCVHTVVLLRLSKIVTRWRAFINKYCYSSIVDWGHQDTILNNDVIAVLEKPIKNGY